MEITIINCRPLLAPDEFNRFRALLRFRDGKLAENLAKGTGCVAQQTRTLVGPMLKARHFAITFKTREEFEAAWPHILKVKSQGAPIFLKRGPNFFLDKGKAGVVVHCPPKGQWDNPKTPETPIKGYPTESPHRWQWTNYIELVVDGEIVDLNRIQLPADTPIIDKRFEPEKANRDSNSPNIGNLKAN